jgi:hypothetical protein
MSTEINESVNTEQEVSSQPGFEQDQQASASDISDSSDKNNPAYNWAEARKKMKRLEEENRAYKDEFEKIQLSSQNKDPSPEYEEKYENDDILTASQTEKLAAKIAEEIIRKREASTVDERLELKHPDFGHVVSRENIETLKETEPELALSLAHISDPYKQGIAAYKMLKRLGIYQETVSSPEKEKALKNSQKPVSINAVTKNSAIGNAHLFENGLTPALKKQLWEEMQNSRKLG